MPESLSFDRVADRYDATRVHPAEASAEIAAGLMRVGGLQSGAEVLEIGIGTGRIALPLLASGVNVTGIDIAPRMLEQLEAKYAAWQAESGERRQRTPHGPDRRYDRAAFRTTPRSTP